MSYRANDPYYAEFVTSNPTTGAAVNADSLPVATANRNGTDDATFTLTVANLDAGRYKVTGTVPAGYVAGDTFIVSVAATVATIAAKGIIDSQVIDSRVADVGLPTFPANFAALAIDTSGRVKVQTGITRGQPVPNFEFFMSDANGIGLPGLTITATVSLDGATPAPCANPVGAVGGGLYKIDLAGTDTDAGVFTLFFTAPGVAARPVTFITTD